MFVITAANASLILTTLITSGYFQNSLTPEQAVGQLAKLYGKEQELAFLANVTKLSEYYLKGFVNHTVKCLDEIEDKIPKTTILTSVFVVDSIRVKCFGLERIIPTSLQCHNEDLSGITFGIMLSLGFLFVTMTMFTTRRHKASLNCCYGYPGPVIPLNMLDSYENRRGFMLSFGLVATLCLNVLLSNYDRLYGVQNDIRIKSWPSYTQILMKIVSAIFISITGYPFFVCQNMKNRVLGSLIGIFFCVVWICLEAYRGVQFMSTCFQIWAFIGYGEVVGVLLSLSDYPLYICLLLLLCKFIYIFVTTLIHRQRRKAKGEYLRHWMFENDTDWKTEYMYLHVKNLFKKIPKAEKSVEFDNFDEEKNKSIREKFDDVKKKFRKSLYQYKPEFKYSTRMMSSVFVTYIGMYQVTIAFSMYAYLVFLAIGLIFDIEVVKKAASLFNIDTNLILKWVDAVNVSWWLGLTTALTFSVLVMINSVGWYRKHMIMLRKGDYTFLPRSLRKKKFNSASLMVASMKFAGFQVAYASWGFLMLAFLLFIGYFIIITQIWFAIRDGELTLLLKLLISIWPTIVITLMIFGIQYIMAIKLFLFDKMTLQVDNRRIYHVVSYTMFYFNIFLGFVSCLLRIIFSMIFGIIFLQRLQKSTLPRAAELIDPGYCSYLGYILLEHQHSNPVIQCFTRLLMESVHKEIKHEIHFEPENSFSATKHGILPAGFMDTVDMSDFKIEMRRKKRIKIRWHLFSLLLLNPSLMKYRFKNAIKKRRYNLELFNSLNPNLFWTGEGVRIEKQKNEKDLPENDEKLSGHFEVGKQKVDVRYRRTGTVLEVVYTLKDNVSKTESIANRFFPKSAIKEKEVDMELETVSEIQEVSDETDDISEQHPKVKLMKYKRMDSSAFFDGNNNGENDDEILETGFINDRDCGDNEKRSEQIELLNDNDITIYINEIGSVDNGDKKSKITKNTMETATEETVVNEDSKAHNDGDDEKEIGMNNIGYLSGV